MVESKKENPIALNKISVESPEQDESPFMFDVEDLKSLIANRNMEQYKHMGGIDGIAVALQTNPQTGLSKEEQENDYAERKKAFGLNVNPEPPTKSFLQLVWEALHDRTLIILIIAGTISLILGLIPQLHAPEDQGSAWFEGAAILIAVTIVTLVTAGNDWSKEKQFKNLNKAKQDRDITVVRNGERQQLNIHELLVGDVVVLDTGDQIPADGVFVDGFGVEVDESVMTGESDNVKKTKAKPFMLSGCLVADGYGTMIVTGVGPNSEWGQLLATFKMDDRPTPLQEKLDKMATLIGKIGTGMAFLTFIALVIRWAILLALKNAAGQEIPSSEYVSILRFFIIAVTIIVVAVPEGLPLAVTMSLAYSMIQMLKDKNLVRHLAACETMGGATNICSDKTGTLTLNRMTVVQGWFAGKYYPTIPEKGDINTSVLALLNEGIALNSKAYIHVTEAGKVEFIGNKTECALLLLSKRFGVDYQAIRQAVPVAKMFAFNSTLKRMSVLVEQNSNTIRIYTKGASEIVLARCTQVLTQDGEVIALDDTVRQEIKDVIETMAEGALRTLCLAYADFPTTNMDELEEAPDHDLVCIGLVGIQDPVREEVPEAVRTCQRAGITVRMVTGDYPSTARAIAKECGILTTGVVVEGPVWRTMSDAEKDAMLPRLQVMARSSPTDKFDLVTRLRKHREVVAVTGDGTNDAPALREADIGLSMGIAGTEVAKEASDVVIMDDNFSSIVKAVMWGRSVFDNIRRFVQFQLTVNVVALIVAFVGSLSFGDTPLTAVQLLWVNLIMDAMGALALGTEPPTLDLLDRAPHGRKEGLLSKHMIRNIFGVAAYQLIVLFVLLFEGCTIFGLVANDSHQCNHRDSVHFTIIFNAFVFCQVFNEFNSRKIYDEMNVFKGVLRSKMFLSIIIITVVFQVVLVEWGGGIFNTVGLSAVQWVASVAIGVLVLPVGFLTRLIPVRWFIKDIVHDSWTQTMDSELRGGSANDDAGAGRGVRDDGKAVKEEEEEEAKEDKK